MILSSLIISLLYCFDSLRFRVALAIANRHVRLISLLLVYETTQNRGHTLLFSRFVFTFFSISFSLKKESISVKSEVR